MLLKDDMKIIILLCATLTGCASMGSLTNMAEMKDLALQCKAGQVTSCMKLANTLSGDDEEVLIEKQVLVKNDVSKKENTVKEELLVCQNDLRSYKKETNYLLEKAHEEAFECRMSCPKEKEIISETTNLITTDPWLSETNVELNPYINRK